MAGARLHRRVPDGTPPGTRTLVDDRPPDAGGQAERRHASMAPLDHRLRLRQRPTRNARGERRDQGRARSSTGGSR